MRDLLVENLARKYISATIERDKVCMGDCAWPVGDGTCGYCMEVGKRFLALKNYYTQESACDILATHKNIWRQS